MKSVYGNSRDKSVIDDADVIAAEKIIYFSEKYKISKELPSNIFEIIQKIASRESGYIIENYLQVKRILRWAADYCGVDI